MAGSTCNTCNKGFADYVERNLHYKSEWHRYNLKRKVAGVPGVTETLFLARQSALAEDKRKLDDTPMLYCCSFCGKGYRSSKAHQQHLKSKTHLMRASEAANGKGEGNSTIKPLARGTLKEPVHHLMEEDEESEWEEIDPDEELLGEASDSLKQLHVNGGASNTDMDGDEDDSEDLDPCCCFMCDLVHDTIESCMAHMHKQHGFFIPDIEYLKDPKGLLICLGLKVKRDFTCLHCNEECHPFRSLWAVRKHMEAKSHCKVHYGDGSEDEEAELEEFYDYSSSYVGTDGKQLADKQNSVALSSGGSELVITKQNNGAALTKTVGSREYLRYYRQKPRPTGLHSEVTAALASSRYKSIGQTSLQPREHEVGMKKCGVEAMRSKIGMKSNVIRNLPNNVPY